MKIDVLVPAIGESVTEATVGTWLKDNGEFAEEDEVICEVESEKATIEIVAEKAGIITLKVEEGEIVAIGAVIAQIDTDAKADVKKAEDKSADQVEEEPAKDVVTQEEKSEPEKHARISPVASNILEEAGISPSEVRGSGTGGRITKTDALKAVEKGTAKPDADQTAATKAKEIPDDRSERREKMTTLRKTIARRLLDAKHGTAMLTTFNEIDLLKVKELRAQYKELFEDKHGVGLGFMSFFTKAVSIALEEIPKVNAMIDGDEVIYHNYADIGIAVSTDRGLVVPIIRNAEKLALHEIELEIVRLATKARDGKLSIDEMTGGTFTITNGGVFGSMLSTPIINTPQSAILGMHNIIDRPVAIDGEVLIRPMMYVAMSYDHRIIDGKESVTFVKRIKEILEDPARIILEV